MVLPSWTLAALINALKIVGKRIEDVRIVLSGVGAAGSAIAKLLMAHGATDIVGSGAPGLSAANTEGMNAHRKWLAENTNPRQVTGSLKEGSRGPTSSSASRRATCSSPRTWRS